jgi:hypothetical protein
MSRLEHERRSPRIHVDDLRRDLRHADQELYAFHSSTNRRAARNRRVQKGTTRTVLVIGLSGGLATAVWGALPLHQTTGPRTVHAAVHAVETASQQPADDVAATLTATVVEPAAIAVPSPDRARNRASASTKSITRSPGRAKALSGHPPPRRPRPLSPGEFGRFDIRGSD